MSLLVISVPMALIFIGIALNSLRIVHEQPQFSLEEDPVHKLAAERRANYHFFHLQRARMLKRQKRVTQYSWLVLGLFVASSWWSYADAVKVTSESKQIRSLETLAVAGSDEAVLSLTLGDGSTAQYRIKAPESQARSRTLTSDPKETLHSWQLASVGTALDVGDAVVPSGMALKISR